MFAEQLCNGLNWCPACLHSLLSSKMILIGPVYRLISLGIREPITKFTF
ncbi:hypothetical protein LSH36_292g01003 [Paralvinella palmiformis]|uniref:Uncharacterized protein n=1 Tax=Paralvinella palmiformis TaxID=53620 RepID=A0AAD9JID0_9ANNE|nr:hypothetical protein LSH36_292g01003 [Paralvinella palmiformis]